MESTSRRSNCFIVLLTIGFSAVLFVNADNCIHATCTISAMNTSNLTTVSGVIKLWQCGDSMNTTIAGDLVGFTMDGLHGFHVHDSGNLSNSCIAAGPHYNPYNRTHGGPNDTNRHVGDLGNIMVTMGKSSFTIVDWMVRLMGNISVVNRSLVVHAGPDDLGKGNYSDSNTTGHSGGRVGCCTIMLDPPMSPTTVAPMPTTTLAGVSIRPMTAVFAVCLVVVGLALDLVDRNPFL